MENLNNSPVLILRQNNKQFRARQKALNRRVKNKAHLREEIYSNHNIFQSSINLYRNMTAQNLIWDKNYSYKCVINAVKEENSALRARIWNVEKENRKMERQIESWSLADSQAAALAKKPYIDMATVERVLKDQDYNIVSLKMQIFDLEKELQQRSAHYEAIQQRNKEVAKIASVFNHQIADRKIAICEAVGEAVAAKEGKSVERGQRERMSVRILQQSQTLDLIAKNTEIKKKSRANIENDLASITHECDLQKNITYQEIERLNEETRRMRAEEDGGVNIQREKLKLAERTRLDYECHMQEQMGCFIKTKMPLQLEIQRMRQALAAIEGGPGKKKSLSIE